MKVLCPCCKSAYCDCGPIGDDIICDTHRRQWLPIHNCMDNAVPYTSDGALGHGWECGKCGRFLQAG